MFVLKVECGVDFRSKTCLRGGYLESRHAFSAALYKAAVLLGCVVFTAVECRLRHYLPHFLCFVNKFVH